MSAKQRTVISTREREVKVYSWIFSKFVRKYWFIEKTSPGSWGILINPILDYKTTPKGAIVFGLTICPNLQRP